MELTGDLLIHAPREKVWQALNDPAMLARCIPGCEEVQRISPDETHARVALKMGPVRARFVGKILMSEVQENRGCELNFEGSGGAAGFARGSSTVTLDDEASATRLRYTAQASVGGKLGQIGGRMIDASAKQMADQFFNAMQRELAAPAAADGAVRASAGPAGIAAPAAGSAATPAASSVPAPSTYSQASTVGQASAGLAGEGIRLLWFVLGSASTGFGVWLATRLAH